jgi:hypothetical protein
LKGNNKMIRATKWVTSACFLGPLALGFMPMGCSSNIGPVTARQTVQSDRPDVPRVAVERLKECASTFGGQLEPMEHRFRPEIKVTDKGKIVEVVVDDIPGIARDFKICVKQALNDIDVPLSWLLRMRDLKEAMEKDQASVDQRKFVGMPGAVKTGSSPLIVAVVGIAFAELALQAAGYTFLFAIGVTLVHELGKNAWRAECAMHYEACILAGGQYKNGNHWTDSRCGTCLAACTQEDGWPSSIGNGSCEYWRPNWK